jgi:hypothetical protein
MIPVKVNLAAATADPNTAFHSSEVCIAQVGDLWETELETMQRSLAGRRKNSLERFAVKMATTGRARASAWKKSASPSAISTGASRFTAATDTVHCSRPLSLQFFDNLMILIKVITKAIFSHGKKSNISI